MAPTTWDDTSTSAVTTTLYATASTTTAWDNVTHVWWEPTTRAAPASLGVMATETGVGEAEVARIEREHAVRRREERKARLKSLRLLKEVLGPQWQEYRVDKAVVVRSGGHKPGVRYRIRPNRMIEVLDSKGRVTDLLCVHTVEWVPDGDDVAAKYLLAAADEERLWKVANRHPPGVQVG